MPTIPHTGTEYVANAITFARGGPGDVTRVGVFHTEDPNVIPEPDDFTEVVLVEPGDPLADGQNTDVLSLVGPRDGDDELAAGDWQRWILVSTATEDIIRRVDVLEVL